jgi:3-oxoacyl-[acyl-carrier-protein] synthase-1
MRAIADAHPGTFTTGAAFPNGHAAGLLALAAGARQVARGASDACIVAGVDSYIAPETLEWLEERNLLHGGGLRKNPWGFLPGEGAGALLLARAGVFERLGLTAVSSLLGFGSAFEAKGARTQTVCIGEGLTAALRAALATLPKRARVTDLYCDMNGEPGRADEYGFATLRVSEAYDPDLQCETPVDCLGDTGAASGVLFAVLAAIAAAKGYSRGTTALIHCASETGERAAATLHTPTPEER